MKTADRSPASQRYLRAANAARKQQAPAAQLATRPTGSNLIATLIVIAAVAVVAVALILL